MVNLEKMNKLIIEHFDDVTVSSEIEKELLSIYFEPFQIEEIPFISVGIHIYVEGFLSFSVSFGDVRKSYQLYDLVNDFNEHTILKASIRDEDLLSLLMIHISHNSIKTCDLILNQIDYYFNTLLFSDDTKEFLLPIIKCAFP